MRFFKRKIGIQELSLEFYNTQVFHPRVDLGAVAWDAVRGYIAEADGTIMAVEEAVFLRELNALRVELFDLACVH